MEEIRIKVPWGHIAGKWWGPKNVRPILSIHGWQDNAGSFDTLIPMLPDHVGYLAIDLPGHGLSSHFPEGMLYSTLDFLYAIELIRHSYKWDKISFMAHSMGSKLSFNYSACFPKRSDLLIGIDVLKPLVRPVEKISSDMGNQLDKLIVEYQRNSVHSEPPTYTAEELIEILYKGTSKSVTRETAPYLLKRAVQESTTQPNRFYFVRDNRIKILNYAITYHQLNLHMAKRITAPHLFIKAAQATYYENKKYHDETIEALQQSNPDFEVFIADGTHHIHLTEPERISAKISEYISKYRPAV